MVRCYNADFFLSFLSIEVCCMVNEGFLLLSIYFWAVANAPVPVMADMTIKVLVNLKLQPRRHTGGLLFTSIHLMYLMIHFLM